MQSLSRALGSIDIYSVSHLGHDGFGELHNQVR
jgi:hypothetical protein